jgi:hypothetical protein
MVLSIEGRAFVVECFFREGNIYSDLVQQLYEIWRGVGGAAKSAMYRDRPRTLNDFKNCNNCVHTKHLTSRSAESVWE